MRRPLWLINVVAGLLLAGCVSVGQSSLADQATLDRIKVGQTTKQELISLLGEPSSSRRTEHAGTTREWWVYERASSIINPLEYLFLYGFWTNGVGLFDTRQDLQVFFDAAGIVSSYSLQSTSYDMGSPVRALHVASTAVHAMLVGGRKDKPINFADRMEYRY